MSNPRGFLTVKRADSGYRPVNVRLRDFNEVENQLPEQARKLQASRCMDCGIPFCHWACPVENIMPEWQTKLAQGDWKAAYDILQDTNNFPEFTGRICPAPCEISCVLSINDEPVTIRENEFAVIERAFQEGYVKPHPPEWRTGKKVAVIGSGPAGLACADIVNKAGHTVVLYEAADAVGGFLRYGVPDFKLDKRVIDRRVNILLDEGLIIKTGVEVGKDISISEITSMFDAVCIATGARKARELRIEGRDLDGIHQATVYLEQQNRVNRGDKVPDQERITAANKQVIVIGGGDTGSDCIGTANRQGARSVTQIEILPAPPRTRSENEPWPVWPKLYKTSSSHEEGCERLFSIATREFSGEDGKVNKLSAVRVEWQPAANGQYRMTEVAGSEFELEADLVLLAMGFEHTVHEGLVEGLGVQWNSRGNIVVDENFMTNVSGVFAAGDSTRGASLIVWAIHEGREAAKHINDYLSSPVHVPAAAGTAE
jgi:glutamate synthase (NADPH/NADH) small chain